MVTAWHAIRAKPGAEGKALIGIKAARLQAFLPVERIRVQHRATAFMLSWRPLFPGYLFAAFDPGRDLPRLLELDGVQNALRVGDQLAVIPTGVVEVLQQAQQAGMFDRTMTVAGFGLGEQVRILDGPFAGLVARVSSARAKKRIQVVVDFVHNLTVPVDKLERVRA